MRPILPAIMCSLLLAACSGERGTSGQDGAPGQPGQDGPAGPAYFTGPGLAVELEAASLAPDGVASVTVRIADAEGTPLDRMGLLTEGSVTLRFLLSELEEVGPGDAGHYRALTLETPPLGGAQRPGPDAGGTFVSAGSGRYVYTFATDVAAPQTAHAHRLAAWGWRDRDGRRHVANAVLDFVPAGGPVTTRRETVASASCAACHREVAAHGVFRDLRFCAACHTPQATDADTGVALELGVLLHKVHAGKDLKSVAAGGTFGTVDDAGVTHDFSEIGFPRDLRHCTACHAGPQADLWKTRPTRAGCASCHDTTSFVDPAPATSVLHTGGAQADDTSCTVCHSEGGVSPPSLRHPQAVAGAQLALDVLSVTTTAPGAQPTVVFRATVDGLPRDLLSSPVASLRATVAGPTTDYATYWQATIQGSGASGTLSPVDAANGVFSYVLPAGAAIPLTAAGSYALALEGYAVLTSPRLPVRSLPVFFAVTDGSVVPRRTVVDDAACDACHGSLTAHGGGRRGAQLCVMCHHPNNAGDERAPHLESATVAVPSVDFRVLVHKLHRGTALSVQPYLVGGNPSPSTSNPLGSPIDFGRVRFPGDLRDCRTCHLPGTFDLPLAAGLLPTRMETRTCTQDPAADTDAYCSPAFFVVDTVRLVPPTAAVCTACHDAPHVAAHAETETTAGGAEGCATCHAAGSAFGIDRAHAVEP